MSKIATVYGAEIKLLAATRSWEEFFIHAKPVLDQADANELNILLPKSEEAKCNELVPFVCRNLHIPNYICTHSHGQMYMFIQCQSDFCILFSCFKITH